MERHEPVPTPTRPLWCCAVRIGYRAALTRSMIFSASATLVDAKAALDKVAGAQDIIVTGSGSATAPLLGWLATWI